jgi:hypothetical protein
MVHAFYVVMGGLVLDVSSTDEDPPSSPLKCTLTADGVRTVADVRPELFENLTKAYIQDKSKANGLAKLIVCSQASWFMIQCLSRLGQRLPITLLEVSDTVIPS